MPGAEVLLQVGLGLGVLTLNGAHPLYSCQKEAGIAVWG